MKCAYAIFAELKSDGRKRTIFVEMFGAVNPAEGSFAANASGTLSGRMNIGE